MYIVHIEQEQTRVSFRASQQQNFNDCMVSDHVRTDILNYQMIACEIIINHNI